MFIAAIKDTLECFQFSAKDYISNLQMDCYRMTLNNLKFCSEYKLLKTKLKSAYPVTRKCMDLGFHLRTYYHFVCNS